MPSTDARSRRSPRGVTGPLIALALLGLGAAGVVGVVAGRDGGAAGGAEGAGERVAVAERSSSPSSSPSPSPSGTPAPAVPVAPATPPAVASASPTAPVRVVVAAQRIDVPVDPVGVAADGQMEIPPLAERGGWYRFGADPGSAAGTTVIAAHVDSLASGGTGPFVRLGEVRPGDAVEVGLADGSTRRYAVVEVARFPKSEARWPDVFTRDGLPRVALVTCGGAFDRDARRYADNVLVIATPVGA